MDPAALPCDCGHQGSCWVPSCQPPGQGEAGLPLPQACPRIGASTGSEPRGTHLVPGWGRSGRLNPTESLLCSAASLGWDGCHDPPVAQTLALPGPSSAPPAGDIISCWGVGWERRQMEPPVQGTQSPHTSFTKHDSKTELLRLSRW